MENTFENIERGTAFPRSLDELIATSEIPVLVEFWSEKFAPCLLETAIVRRVSTAFAGSLLTVRLNVEKHPDVAERHKVHSVPTVMMFWKGCLLMRVVGLTDYDELRQNIELHWPHLN